MKKQVLVTVDRGETRVAILEGKGEPAQPAPKRGGRRRRKPTGPSGDWRVAEMYIERRGRRSILGNIYKGKVDNVLGGMEAAFVDIGLEKNGFLHVDEIVTPDGTRTKRGRGGGKRISELLKPKQEILVQATKDPLKSKGARLTMELAIPARYMVYVPDGEGVGVSRRLPDKERERLRRLAKKLDVPEGGIILRTAAEGVTLEELERELVYLRKLTEVMEKRAKPAAAPSMVFQEADLSVRVIRDVLSKDFERAVIDDAKQHHRVEAFFLRTTPSLAEKVELYTDETPLFEAYGVEQVIQSTLSRRVDLPSGGYLIIDYAEAMTVIDVNTGSFTGRGRGLEGTITTTNLEAAEEVVRQLRLRDIGGIIVIDFIDMARARNRNEVLKVLRKALDEDRTKTYVMEISPLGLVEMTRQNVTDGVREILTKTCPTCDGEGVVLSEDTIAIDVERKLRDLAAESKSEAFLIRVHPRVASILIGGGGKPLQQLEEETERHFHFEGVESMPLDTFSVTAEGTKQEIADQALPFSEGEEVLLDIVEPHMYNADDAIAKVDGYVISVVGGADFVGERKMVRIGEVKRTAAYAVVISDNGAEEGIQRPAAAEEKAGGEAVDSNGSAGKRRRGRRGGRRRSRAGAGTGSKESSE